jgi:hypothetical protein
MAEWLEEHMVAIGSFNINFDLVDRIWLNRRLGGALRWNVETIDWEGQGVVCGKPAPLRL